MNNLYKAAQQALLVLESGLLVSHSSQVVTALRAALAEPVEKPVEEPVAWMRVIDEAMVVHHCGVADPADDYETAKRKMNNLLCTAQDIGTYFAKQAEPGDLMAAAQQFLNWNRSQTPPRVEVGFELGVFEAAIQAYTRRPTTEKSSVVQTAALGYWVGTTFVDVLVTEVDGTVGVVVFPKCGVGATVSHFRLGGTIVELEYPLALLPEDVPYIHITPTTK